MIIERRRSIEPQFHQDLRRAVLETHAVLGQAGFATRAVKQQLNQVRVVARRRLYSIWGMVECSNEGPERITVSYPRHVAYPGELLNTMVHEVAHLLVDHFYGPEAEHGPHWQRCMDKLGFPYGADIDVPLPPHLPALDYETEIFLDDLLETMRHHLSPGEQFSEEEWQDTDLLITASVACLSPYTPTNTRALLATITTEYG